MSTNYIVWQTVLIFNLHWLLRVSDHPRKEKSLLYINFKNFITSIS